MQEGSGSHCGGCLHTRIMNLSYYQIQVSDNFYLLCLVKNYGTKVIVCDVSNKNNPEEHCEIFCDIKLHKC